MSYQITVVNESGEPQSFVLTQDSPIQNGDSSIAVFMSSSDTPSSGQANFEIDGPYYAVTGATSGPLEPGIRVYAGDYSFVDPQGGGDFRVTLLDGTPVFGGSGSSTSQSGNFWISVSNEISPADNVFIGMGSRDQSGEVIPVAVCQAYPNQVYDFFPRRKYTLATSNGPLLRGTIVTPNNFGSLVSIDFDSLPSRQVAFTYNATGVFVQNTEGERANLVTESVVQSQPPTEEVGCGN
ncbi:hypothetical protein ABW19_dt0203859 [Dactylella cylindrospora]|nr:hypothetical protein ABW19_dt0203859 [Dactylella cylindrospora]